MSYRVAVVPVGQVEEVPMRLKHFGVEELLSEV